MIKKLILLRHGTSQGNIDRSAYEKFPDYAIRLTKKGAEQARDAGNKLKEIDGNFHAIFSSYFRARQTFEFASETLGEDRILSARENILIREQEWQDGGLSPFKQGEEDKRNHVGSLFYRFGGGESGADCYNRLLIFHELIASPMIKNLDGNLLIVAHGFSIRVYLKILLGWDVETFEMCRNPKNAEIIQIGINDGNFELESDLNIRPKRVAKFNYDKNDLY